MFWYVLRYLTNNYCTSSQFLSAGRVTRAKPKVRVRKLNAFRDIFIEWPYCFGHTLLCIVFLIGCILFSFSNYFIYAEFSRLLFYWLFDACSSIFGYINVGSFFWTDFLEVLLDQVWLGSSVLFRPLISFFSQAQENVKTSNCFLYLFFSPTENR